MATFTLRKDLPCILIDASYYVFYRYFDSWKYFRKNHNEQLYNTEELHKVTSFLRRVYIDIDTDIAEMLRSWHTNTANIIFCKDCSRKSIWRNEHTENYKSTRPTKMLFNPHMFSIVSQYCKDRRIQEMYMDKLEADDIIALTKQKLRNGGYTQQIIIVTNDNDYLQLLDENTHAYNMNMENNNLRQRSIGSAKMDLCMKILMGDRSDNIPPVKHHMGPKKAMKLAKLPDTDLEAYLAKHGCKEAYERNMRLIDFNYIRPDLKQLYHESIHLKLQDAQFKVY